VRALIRSDRRALEGLDVEIVEGDINDPQGVSDFIEGASAVYHLAAQISIQGDPNGAVSQTNAEGTQNIVDACLAHSVDKLIHFSSLHALEDPAPGSKAFITEENPLADAEKHIAYDRSKATAERIVLKGVQRGLDACIVNPGGILGPYDFKPSRMGDALIQLHERRIPGLVEGGFAWVDVRDVVEAAITAENKGRAGERYILAGDWASFRELSHAIEKVAGVKPPFFTSPIWLAKMMLPFVAGFTKITGGRPLYTMESLCIVQCHRHVSYEKAQQELDFRPRPLQDTLRDTFAWFKSEGVIS